MVRVISMLQMVLLVLLLKESDAVNWECSELQNTISGLETNISSITEEKHKKEQFFGQCEVSIYICVYVYICIYIYILYIYILYIYIYQATHVGTIIVIITDLKYKTEHLVRHYYVGCY